MTYSLAPRPHVLELDPIDDGLSEGFVLTSAWTGQETEHHRIRVERDRRMTSTPLCHFDVVCIREMRTAPGVRPNVHHLLLLRAEYLGINFS